MNEPENPNSKTEPSDSPKPPINKNIPKVKEQTSNRVKIWWLKSVGCIEKHHASIEIFLTIAAIVVATLLFCETQKQVKISRDTLQHQRYQDSIATMYQERRDSLSIASFQQELRAYISANLDLNYFERMSDTVQSRWILHNTGRTPARKVRVLKRLQDIEMKKTDWDNLQLPYNVFSLSSGIPDTIYSFVKFGTPVVTDFWNNKMSVFFAVLIEYEDIFHHLHHCYAQEKVMRDGPCIAMPTPDDD